MLDQVWEQDKPGTPNQTTVYCQGSQELKQGGNLGMRTEAETGDHGYKLLPGLISTARSVCFLITFRTTCPGVDHPTMGWAFSHQVFVLNSNIIITIIRCLINLPSSYGGIFSTEGLTQKDVMLIDTDLSNRDTLSPINHEPVRLSGRGDLSGTGLPD